MKLCQNTPCCYQPYDFAEERGYFEKRKIPFQIIEGKHEGFRDKVKLAVRGTKSHPLIGLFYPGTHEVFQMTKCSLHAPGINEAIEKVQNWMISEKIVPYSETNHTGDLRYIQLVRERESGKIQLTLVLNYDNAFPDFQGLVRGNEGFWHSIFANFQPEKSNTIFGKPFKLLFGEEWLKETLLGDEIFFHPGSFLQANLSCFEMLLKTLYERVKEGASVLELYAGVGAIGIPLSKKAAEVTLLEVNETSKEAFEKTLSSLDVKRQKRLHFTLSDAAYLETKHLHHDTCIVDPPRKGLSKSVIQKIGTAEEIQDFFYISCGFESLLRDIEAIEKEGFKIAFAEGYLFFPGSGHLETLVHFTRS